MLSPIVRDVQRQRCSKRGSGDGQRLSLYDYGTTDAVERWGSTLTCTECTAADSEERQIVVRRAYRPIANWRHGDRKVATLGIAQCHSIYAQSFSAKFGANIFGLSFRVFENGFFGIYFQCFVNKISEKLNIFWTFSWPISPRKCWYSRFGATLAPQREYQHFLGKIGQENVQKMFSFSDILFTKHWK